MMAHTRRICAHLPAQGMRAAERAICTSPAAPDAARIENIIAGVVTDPE